MLVEQHLKQPPHLDDDRWAAIRKHEDRLTMAISVGDKPWIIGSAKELMESTARAVVEAKNVVVASNADFDTVVNAAHNALERQVGPNLDGSNEVRTVASSSRKIASAVRAIRNNHGTGHGRATIDEIDDELTTVTVDACYLWSRWALCRLGHALANEPQRLIDALQQGMVTQAGLARQLIAVRMPQQPPDMQRALGAAFAQRWASGGTFVAHRVGVAPAVASTSLTEFPIDYRQGVAEGLTLTGDGRFLLATSYLPDLVGALQPIPASSLKPFLTDLAAKVRSAGLASTQSADSLDELAAQTEAEGARLDPDAQSAWSAFASSLRGDGVN